jgi:hypothetical protein
VSLSLSVIVDPPETDAAEIAGATVGIVVLVRTTVLGLCTSPAFALEALSSYVSARPISSGVPFQTSVPEK